MNCKPGDLALVVSGERVGKGRNSGKMVTCLRLANDDELQNAVGPYFGVYPHAVWHVDRDVIWFRSWGLSDVTARLVPDKHLMPIHPKGDEQHTEMKKELET